jgi:acetyltransferase-like isoleucine patch superfamily enzyme
MLNIYITDLAAYNAGVLVGEWVSLPTDKFALTRIITEILAKGEAATGEEHHEEFFITDYEWSFMAGEIREVGEYEDPYALNREAFLLGELDQEQLKAVSFLLSQGITNTIEDAITKADDVIIHPNCTLKDVAYVLAQEYYAVDELAPLIANHIDYDGIARDLRYEGLYWEIGNDVYEYAN